MVALLIISQRNLGVAMFVGAFILGVLTIPESLPAVFWSAVTDPSTILLAVVVGLIPIIGGTLKVSGQMDNLVSNMRIGKKAFLMLSPALVGMLPMPGGALLSAPLIEKGGRDVSNEKKAGLNVWFRHILYLVYPLSPALIISAEVAQVDVYQAIPYLVPALFFSLFIGYFFFLRDVAGKMDYEGDFSLKNLLLPLTAILVAPVLVLLIKTFLAMAIKEIATLIAVSVSLLIAAAIGRVRLKKFGEVVLKARPWNFASMMIGIMVFLNVFQSSGIPQLIGTIHITPEILFVIGFLLGFGTGRIITPAGIVFPIFLTRFGAISLPTFAILYFGIFLGYIITPVHPCVSLSVESFKTELKGYFKAVTPPTLIALVVSISALYAMNL
jgi:integral membrane protein (TIGR00529 family)